MIRLVPVVVAMTLLVGCEQGPTHQGRPLSFWTAELDAKQEYRRRGGCDAIGAIGPAAAAAIPQLVERLEDDSPGVRFAAEQALPKMGPTVVPRLEPFLDRPDPELRFHATIALLEVEPSHERAGEELVRFAVAPGDPEISKQARSRATRLGAAILPRLLAGLDDPSPQARIAVLEIITGMRLEAVGSVDALVAHAAKEPEAAVRRQIVLTLGHIGPREKVEAPLRGFLEDRDESVAIASNSMLVFVGALVRPTTGQVEEEENAPREDNKPLKSLLSEY